MKNTPLKCVYSGKTPHKIVTAHSDAKVQGSITYRKVQPISTGYIFALFKIDGRVKDRENGTS